MLSIMGDDVSGAQHHPSWRELALALAVLVAVPACRTDVPRATPPEATPAVEPFCEAARGLVERLGGIVSVPSDTQVGPLYRELETFFREATNVVPPDLRADAVLAQEAVAEYYLALEQVGFDTVRVPVETAARLGSTEFGLATARLAQYSQKRCGLPA